MIEKEGIVKFVCTFKESTLPSIPEFDNLIMYRNILFKAGLIGSDIYGIGYGNISCRLKDSDEFIITGSQTSGKSNISIIDFSIVTHSDISKNKLSCMGQVVASSESLTHAAAYQSNKDINAVIHIHNQEIWSKFLNRYPTTSKSAHYGTPEIAFEIKDLCKKSCENFLILGGHKSGILVTGESLDTAFKLTNSLLTQ